MIANSKHLIRRWFAAQVIFIALLAIAAGQPGPEWQADDYQHRYKVVFPPLKNAEWAEVGMLEFRADFGPQGDPYDMRALDAGGEIIETFVLDWVPDQDALPNSGKLRCLVDLAKLRNEESTSFYIYMGKPDATLELSEHEWPAPLLIIGSSLDRTNNRHGQWHWLRDPTFEAVHAATAPNAATRVSHSITALDSIYFNASTGRLTQAVYLDPADPPSAISLELILNNELHSFYWTNEEKPPEDSVAEPGRTKKVGPLPESGKWQLLELLAEDIDQRRSHSISGIGFSNHGGSVRWGPTAMEAMPARGEIVSHEIRSEEGLVESADLRPLETTELRQDALELDIVAAPFFVSTGERLSLTWLVSPSYRYLGPLPRRQLEVVAYNADDQVLWSEIYPIVFTGGDSWQRTLLVPPEAHADADRIEGRLLDEMRPVKTRNVLIANPGPIKGLHANGNLLVTRGDVVVYRLHSGVENSEMDERSSATLVFTPEVVPSWYDLETKTDERRYVSINASDGRLGLPRPVLAYVQRTPAEWVVAAAHAAQSRHFDRARIEITPALGEIGVALPDMRPFLSGIITLLQSAGIEVEIDLEALRREADTPRERALLAACMEISFQLERDRPE